MPTPIRPKPRSAKAAGSGTANASAEMLIANWSRVRKEGKVAKLAGGATKDAREKRITCQIESSRQRITETSAEEIIKLGDDDGIGAGSQNRLEEGIEGFSSYDIDVRRSVICISNEEIGAIEQ